MTEDHQIKYACIRRLEINRFRGIEHLEWLPHANMNVILGGGDVGKTTVLDAVALLLSASSVIAVSETDYWQRDSTADFSIEAVMSFPDAVGFGTHSTFNWPWEWNGEGAVQPALPDDGSDDAPAPNDPVYRLRVRGTPDLELIWEVVQPDGEAVSLSAGLRRKIGLVRLSTDDRNDRDLRLVYGSALDRLLADAALRSRIAKQVSEQDLSGPLGKAGTQKLETLDQRLKGAGLPHGIKLGLTSSQGLSIGALIGLLAEKSGVSLPLGSWGAGTRRMAALEIASTTQAESRIAVVDEIERGLEPYRLRQLVKVLRTDFGQSFITTHSPVAVACTAGMGLWYIDGEGKIGGLSGVQVLKQQLRDAETFLAKLALIAEGETEVGFLKWILDRAFGADPLDHGVRVCLGQGNQQTLSLLETLEKSGLTFAALVDDEGEHPERWGKLKAAMGARLLQWKGCCTEEAVIGALEEKAAVELLKDHDGTFNGRRMRTLAVRLGIADKSIESINAALEERGLTLKSLIIQAASGNSDDAPEADNKEWKSHGKDWFKSEVGGRELAGRMVELGAWPKLAPLILPLVNFVLGSSGFYEIQDLPHE